MRKAIIFAALAAAGAGALAHGDWRSAGRESANLAPLPAAEAGAVIQAYAAPVWGWRGFLADHTWIAVKTQNAAAYTVYEVVGWRLRRGMSALRVAEDIPDRHWYGGRPRLLLDVRGDKAEHLAADIARAAQQYPFAGEYRAFSRPQLQHFHGVDCPRSSATRPQTAAAGGWQKLSPLRLPLMPPPLSVETKLTDPRARPPDYATPGAAGMDLRACLDEPLTIAPGETVIVGTGVAVFIRDSGYVGLLAPRSGLGVKHGIVLANSVGIIDSDYQDENSRGAFQSRRPPLCHRSR